jgi:hypothetical protein
MIKVENKILFRVCVILSVRERERERKRLPFRYSTARCADNFMLTLIQILSPKYKQRELSPHKDQNL